MGWGRAALAACAAASAAPAPSRGYLFVSNRLDEVIVARLSLPRWANVTLVADAATVAELESRERVAAAPRAASATP